MRYLIKKSGRKFQERKLCENENSQNLGNRFRGNIFSGIRK